MLENNEIRSLCEQGHYSSIECKAYSEGILRAVRIIQNDCLHTKFEARCLHQDLAEEVAARFSRVCTKEDN